MQSLDQSVSQSIVIERREKANVNNFYALGFIVNKNKRHPQSTLLYASQLGNCSMRFNVL